VAEHVAAGTWVEIHRRVLAPGTTRPWRTPGAAAHGGGDRAAVLRRWPATERHGSLTAVDRDEMLRVLRAFEREGLEYVLIGAAAMGFHGLVRATEDLDVVIRATPENVGRLKRALRIAYDDDPNVDEISATDLLGDYPVVRYYPPSGDLYFDVLTRLGETASFESVEAETKQVEGIRVRVATPEALYRLKQGTVRPLDRHDAEALRRRFDLQEK